MRVFETNEVGDILCNIMEWSQGLLDLANKYDDRVMSFFNDIKIIANPGENVDVVRDRYWVGINKLGEDRDKRREKKEETKAVLMEMFELYFHLGAIQAYDAITVSTSNSALIEKRREYKKRTEELIDHLTCL